MRYPKFLKDGGTIGFIAPSFGCAIEPYRTRFDRALKDFQLNSYEYTLGPNCLEGSGTGISNTPKKCAEELNNAMTGGAFSDGVVPDVIITCGGGELMCEVVPYIDFEKIKNSEPKWYMGYSDNTNYTFLSAILADTAAIYGPCAPAFGREPWHRSIEDALDILRGEVSEVHGFHYFELDDGTAEGEEPDPLAPYNLTEKVEYKYYHNGSDAKSADIEGRLLGGCLDILTLHAGTKYDKVAEFNERYKEDGVIWFVESCDLDILSMRRAYWQLREAGWFDTAKGFLIGRPRRCYGEEVFGVDQYSAVTDILGDLGVPIIMDLDIGHLPPMMPIVCGSKAKVTAKDNDISIKYIFE